MTENIAPLLYPMGQGIDQTSAKEEYQYAGDVAAPRPLLSADGWILMAARFVRLFSYGYLAVALILYLVQLGLSQLEIGSLFTVTILGDLIVTLWLTTRADALGRRHTLLIAALLKVLAGSAYAFSNNYWALLLCGFVGIISPTVSEKAASRRDGCDSVRLRTMLL